MTTAFTAETPGPRGGPGPSAPVPDVEREIARDLIRRGLLVLPALVALAGAIWGVRGALSAAYAVGLVLANFALSAALLARAARTSLALLMVAALGGYLVRLGLITVAVLAVRREWWVAMVPLGLTIIVTHLGLLVWEARYVSASLAFPGLKPTPLAHGKER